MKIAIIEPYYTGSHTSWIEGIQKYSSHDIKVFSLPGRHWKWRMQGACVTLADEFIKSNFTPDLILVTDMLHLPVFLSLTKEITHSIPTVIYFHENQITYPLSERDSDVKNSRDNHYGYINYLSSLTADHILFNSNFHMDSYLQALPHFLQSFPDYNNVETVHNIKEKSSVLYIGMDLKKFDNCKINNDNHIPVILWNHRWEYDKNPDDFTNILLQLEKKNIPFELVIIGNAANNIPECFAILERKLKERIIKFGSAQTFKEYAQWLHRADIIPVTSNQDFFGISLMEAMYCKTIPLLPERLTFPELIDMHKFKNYFYTKNDMLEKLIYFCKKFAEIDRNDFFLIAQQYDWSNMISVYDETFEKIAFTY